MRFAQYFSRNPIRKDAADQTVEAGAGVFGRVSIAIVAFGMVYAVIAGRLLYLGMVDGRPSIAYQAAKNSIAAARPDLIDRNGEILATDIKTSSLYAEPRRILDVDDAIEAISSVLPQLDTPRIRRRLESNAGFVWLKRELTPDQQQKIHRLGVPGIGFVSESRRFYPGGGVAGHVIGHVNVDNQGIAGLEKYIDGQGLADLQKLGLAVNRELEPVRLAMDIRVQHVVRDELMRAMERYRAIAAVGIVMNAHTGEVLGMSSVPDYDPNEPAQALEGNRMNRATAGVFELGSVFKTFTTAMALESGKVGIEDSFDARKPLKVSTFTINDFHAKRRVLSVPEIFIYSSNIGTAKMARKVGVAGHKSFMKRFGMLDPITTELPERASPLKPRKWNELSSMTISFGHGLSVSPMHAVVTTAALMNGGMLVPPTFFPRDQATAEEVGHRIVKLKTSKMMRHLFRLNVLRGSGRRAEVGGFRVGGKTGTAEKVVNGRYSSTKRFNSFLAAFPMDDPQYVVLVVLDEPKSEKKGVGATAGLNAAPTVSKIIRRIAPMLRISPKFEGNGTLTVSYR